MLAPVATEKIAALAALYDRFANALDPDTPGRDEAEARFQQLLTTEYEGLLYTFKQEFVQKGGHADLFAPPLTLRDFRREIITRCKAHLRTNRKTSSV